MKKLISLSILFSSPLFAANFSVVGGGTDNSSSIASGSYDKIIISAPTVGETAFSGNSNTGTITLPGTANSYVYPGIEQADILASANYTFYNQININTSTSGRPAIVAANGSTLHFANGLQISGTVTNSHFSGEIAGVKDGPGNIKSYKTGNIIITATTTGPLVKDHVWLEAVNLTIRAGKDSNGNQIDTVVLNNSQYVHFFYNSTLNCETNVSLSALYVRSSVNNTSDNKIGTIKLNGNTLTTKSHLYFNESSNTGNQYGSLTIDMDANKASNFVVGGGMSKYGNDAYTDFTVDFINVSDDDKILFKTALDSEKASIITINGKSGADILTESFTYNGESYTRYYLAVPEPSTYSMIFGAFALMFVACRKRK